MRILITGAAGFIGSHLASQLSSKGNEVWGVDSFSNYYSPDLKEKRVLNLLANNRVEIVRCDISDLSSITNVIEDIKPDFIIHLAAQAGVRLPIEKSQRYLDANVNGFLNVFLATQKLNVKGIIYASSSSVYGDGAPLPYNETWTGLTPKSFYGATKLANEAMAPVLARELGLRVRGLRFFTVYGEWGRPDMAYFRIGAAALGQVPFTLFGDGSVERDFTYVHDVVSAVTRLLDELESRPTGFHDVVNIGGGRPLSMDYLIELFRKKFNSNFSPDRADAVTMDSQKTMASNMYLESLIGKQDFTSLEEGIEKFSLWLKNHEVLPNLKTWIESSI